MKPENNNGRTEHFVLTEQLRVGLFIHIDLPWFRHPFTLNSFKITTEAQLAELRALKQVRFRYDPDRSDGFVAAAQAQEIVAVAAAATVGIAESAPGPEAAEAQADDPALAEKRERVAKIEARRERVAEVEKAFAKAATVMRNLNKHLLSRPKETLEEMGGLVDQMVYAFLEHPEVTLHVMGEKCGGEEAYYHGLNTSVLCMMLAKGLNFTQDQARLLGAAALLHDLGLMEIPDRVLKKRPDEYTKPERELRMMHVEYGVKLGKQIGLPPEVLLAISQHHEFIDGSGYPKGLKGDKMSPLARVLCTVNAYDNLCNPVDFQQAMTPHEALSFLFAQRRGKFDGTVLQLMIRNLGVYPPGSIVRLSNEAIAMVVSVNPSKPLRPWVMLYDSAVPKAEAIMLDLEVETELNIGKAVRPAMLPPAVYAYLSPRKRVTYFFDGDSSSPGAKP